MILPFIGKNNQKVYGEVITTEFRLRWLARRMMKIDEFAFDTETTSLRVQWKGEVDLVGISICFGINDVYYIPTGHYFDKDQLSLKLVLKILKPVFERKNVRIIGHNIKYDKHVLACFDIDIKTTDIVDTMVASFTIDENEQKGLKHLTNLVYKIAQEKYDGCLATVTNEEKKAYGLKASQKPPFQLVRVKIGAPYAMADAYWTWRHYVDWILDQLENEEVAKIYFKVMIPFLRTLYNMERRGVRVNKDKLKEMQAKAEIDLAELEYEILEIAGLQFKVTSAQQIGEILFGYKKFDKKGNFSGNKLLVDNNFGFPVLSTTDGGAPSTGESALLALTKLNFKKDKRKLEGIKMIRLILKYKKLAKLKSAFIDGLLNQVYSDGKVHPTFNLGGASSGRLSCSEPKVNWAVA
jgi:DNA polymerase-1